MYDLSLFSFVYNPTKKTCKNRIIKVEEVASHVGGDEKQVIKFAWLNIDTKTLYKRLLFLAIE